MKPITRAAVHSVLGVTALLVTACTTRSEVDLAAHREVMERVGFYESLQHQTKVLAGCIDWPASRPGNIAVKGLYPYVTAIYSDAPIFTSDLMNAALEACAAARAQRGWTCECVAIDKNGRAVLEVPESFGDDQGAAG